MTKNLSELGEKEIIQKLREFMPNGQADDDTAELKISEGKILINTDVMVEGVHFKLDYTSWRELGWKSFASNLSDIAAMGCQATYAVVTLGVRGDIEVNSLLDLYEYYLF